MVYVFQLQHCSISAIWVDCPASLFQDFSNLVGEFFPSSHLVESRCTTLVLHAFDYVPRWGFPSPHPSSKLPIFFLLILMHHPLCRGLLSPKLQCEALKGNFLVYLEGTLFLFSPPWRALPNVKKWAKIFFLWGSADVPRCNSMGQDRKVQGASWGYGYRDMWKPYSLGWFPHGQNEFLFSQNLKLLVVHDLLWYPHLRSEINQIVVCNNYDGFSYFLLVSTCFYE